MVLGSMLHWRPCMAALIRLVVHACPSPTLLGGCSLLGPLGVIQVTLGRVPALASLWKLVTSVMLPSWWSWCTVSKKGRGAFKSPLTGPLRWVHTSRQFKALALYTSSKEASDGRQVPQPSARGNPRGDAPPAAGPSARDQAQGHRLPVRGALPRRQGQRLPRNLLAISWFADAAGS